MPRKTTPGDGVPQDAAPTLLDGLTLEEILAPRGVPCPLPGGRTVTLYPMDDARLLRLSDDLELVAGILAETEDLETASLTTLAPRLVKLALPSVTRLIAAALGVPEAVAAKIRVADRLPIVQAVLDAEDMALLLKNGRGLLDTFASDPGDEVKGEKAGTDGAETQG